MAGRKVGAKQPRGARMWNDASSSLWNMPFSLHVCGVTKWRLCVQALITHTQGSQMDVPKGRGVAQNLTARGEGEFRRFCTFPRFGMCAQCVYLRSLLRLPLSVSPAVDRRARRCAVVQIHVQANAYAHMHSRGGPASLHEMTDTLAEFAGPRTPRFTLSHKVRARARCACMHVREGGRCAWYAGERPLLVCSW